MNGAKLTIGVVSVLALAGFLCSPGCKKSSSRGGTGAVPSGIDVSGVYMRLETCDESDCDEPEPSISREAIEFRQSGTNVTIVTPHGVFAGRVQDLGGNRARVTWQSRIREGGGQTDHTFTWTVDLNQETFAGGSTWSYKEDADSNNDAALDCARAEPEDFCCDGTCTDEGDMFPYRTPSMDVSGLWTLSENGCNTCPLAFVPPVSSVSAYIIQDGTHLVLETPLFILEGRIFDTKAGETRFFFSGAGNVLGGKGAFTASGRFTRDGDRLTMTGDFVWSLDNGSRACSVECTGQGERLSEDVCEDLGSTLPVNATGNTRLETGSFVPGCAPAIDARDGSFRWVAPSTGRYRMATRGSEFNTVLYVLDAVCGGAEIACNDDVDPPNDRTSALEIALAEGQVVTIVVDGADEKEAGNYRLTIEAAP